MRPLLKALLITCIAFSHGIYGQITVTNTNDSGTGSLRWAIESANANAGTDNISFNIPNTDGGYVNSSGDERWTISPVTDLPEITEAAIVDATTQLGGGNYRIKIDGQSLRTNGILVGAANTEIYGFFVTGFITGLNFFYISTTPSYAGDAGKAI